MGAADVVPGVSGGTIAFITGIYKELIASLNNINLGALKILFKEGIKPFWKHINGTFFVEHTTTCCLVKEVSHGSDTSDFDPCDVIVLW